MALLTPPKAEERCGRSRRSIMRAIKDGVLPAEKTNRGWLIDPDALDAWASAHGQPKGERMGTPSIDAQPAQRIEDATTIAAQTVEIRMLQEQLVEAKAAHAAEVDRLTSAHAAEIGRLQDVHAKQIQDMQAQRDAWMAQATAPRGIRAWWGEWRSPRQRQVQADG